MSGLHIGRAAEAVGVSPSALRRWEREGLVRPRRSESGYRIYSADDVARLRAVRRMRRVDLVNGPGIRRLLARGGGSATRIDGARLRRLRELRGLALRDAAHRCGVSASHLSAIERGTANPSVAALQRITRAYDTTLVELLVSPRASGRVVRRDERSVTALGDGVRIEQLALRPGQLEPQLFVLEPGATSDGAYAHDGEEFLYVLAGTVTVWIGAAESHDLRVGDALTFPSTLPHRWRNTAREETRLLWINTPPTF
jgi:transcriptional regulator with XRE-family HTH domain